MSGRALTSWNCHQSMLRPLLAAVLLLVISPMYLTTAQHYRHGQRQGKHVEFDFVSEVTSAGRETIESLIGRENFKMLSENLSSLIWIVSCGISSALLVVARILGQFLSSFGMAGDHATQFLKLTPVEVQTLLLWGLAAAVVYWVLSLLLRLVLTILSRIMWGIKVVLFATCFIYIVTVVPDRTLQTWLLLTLLTLYVLLGWLSGSNRSGAELEAKIHNLEHQLKELQQRQRWSPRNQDDD